MLRNYLLTAYAVFMRRKLYTAINLMCIVITLVILIIVMALLQTAFFPQGVEGKSDRFLQIKTIQMQDDTSSNVSNSDLGYKVVEKYLRSMKSAELVGTTTTPEPVAAYQSDQVTVLQMRHTDANYWRILDFPLRQGRVLDDADLQQGRFVAVINESSAMKIFPKESALGKKINVSGQQFEVVGVVADQIHFNAFADIWVPITTYASSGYQNQIKGNFNALVMAKSPSDIPAMQREVANIAKTIVPDDPKTYTNVYMWADTKLDMFARSLTGNNTSPDSGARALIFSMIFAALGFMLLPALNLVNLNAGRIMERSTEIGVRKAFGASNRQLVAQFIIENIILCLLGGLLSLLIAQVCLSSITSLELIPYLHVNINFPVFLGGLLLSTIFALISGVIPAWRMARLDPVLALKGIA